MRGGEQWRDIPGLGGWYQASDKGRVRSLRAVGGNSKGQRARQPRLLRPTLNEGKAYLVLHIDGKQLTSQVSRLVYYTWLGAIPDGLVVCHRDGHPENNAPGNLYLTTQKKRMSKRGREIGGSTRRPVVKISRSLEVVAAYRSARQAAKENHFRDKSNIVRLCNFEYRCAPFAPDGFLYAWDEDHYIRKALRLAMADMERRGERFTDPFTEEYYNLPPDPLDGLNLEAIPWADAPGGGGRFG